MNELVFLLEEESARELVNVLFRALVPEEAAATVRFIVFEGKQDLERQLERKLRGYLNPHACFVVMRDQDRGDCRAVKQGLAEICREAGRPDAVVRIACRELESFYLGDLRAVELGLGIHGLAAKQNKARYRDPDHLHSPARELEKLTGRPYQKVAGTRAIAPHLSLDSTRSRSFWHLVRAIRSIGERFAVQG